ncbi:hypothetical protein IE4872_CH01625 [Rhizobium gallicum]|uniref:Uncharacterized protein n=1 Tax=Rhizobium gallicum TaxID=56730 RepID=A0A1L5NHA6_9HYPH|nr:twin-arginine translocation signal domain-containing protein [Rhizobium gallicum]APO67267.1 hypothetical protein IE4872_CH01625 [Rhizobium gallicum]
MKLMSQLTGEAVSSHTRRTILKALGVGGAAAVLPVATAAAVTPAPEMTPKERADYHLACLKAALEEATGKSFHGEIAWDVDAAFLFGRTA